MHEEERPDVGPIDEDGTDMSTTPIAPTHNRALDALKIDRAALTDAMQEMGLNLQGSCAAQMVMGAADVLLALELARALPEAANYDLAIGQLHSFSRQVGTVSPREVVEAQLKVLEVALAEESEPRTALYQSRVARLRARIEQTPLGDLH